MLCEQDVVFLESVNMKLLVVIYCTLYSLSLLSWKQCMMEQ